MSMKLPNHLDLHEDQYTHTHSCYSVFPHKITETVSLQHLSLLIACPVINTLPECPSCSLCDMAWEGTAALMPSGEK